MIAGWLIGLILADIVHFHGTLSFVKQLLINPPTINKRMLWRRSPKNIAIYGNFTLTLMRSLQVPTPSYVQILQQGSLSITSFSLFRKGSVTHFDTNGLRPPSTVNGEYLWPNELSEYRDKAGERVLLIPDGFLMPGQSDGAVYAIRSPDDPNAVPVRITPHKEGWFYHRAVHVKLPGGGEGVLTARAYKGLLGEGRGELVWLSVPEEFQMHSYPNKRRGKWGSASAGDEGGDAGGDAGGVVAGVGGGSSGSVPGYSTFAKPWAETVLATGPDVMFELMDLDVTDDCVEVVAAHFFGRQLSIHSLRACAFAPYVEVARTSTIDTVGRPYGLCLASMDQGYRDGSGGGSSGVSGSSGGSGSGGSVGTFRSEFRRKMKYNPPSSPPSPSPTHLLVTTHECSYDLPSALGMAFRAIEGSFPRVKTPNRWRRSVVDAGVNGGAFKMTEEKGDPDILMGTEGNQQDQLSGGSLFAYKIPNLSAGANVPAGGGERTGAGSRPVLTTAGALPTDPPASPSVASVSASISASSVVEASSVAATATTLEHRREAKATRAKATPLLPLLLSDWPRYTVCSGFKVRGWGGIFSPGAPGFPYVFRMPNKPHSLPLILIAGDCTGSAYVFAPKKEGREGSGFSFEVGEGVGSSGGTREGSTVPIGTVLDSATAQSILQDSPDSPPSHPSEVPAYELVFEIECGATVGSAAVTAIDDGTGDMNLYIPAYELDIVHVFRLSEKDLGMK